MTEETASSKLDSVMRTIQKLLALADHPKTGEAESSAARERAEKLMNEYRVSESELNESATMPLTVPVFRTFPAYPVTSPFRETYLKLLGYVMYHCGIRGVIRSGFDYDSGQQMTFLHMCGYESDLRYAELIYTAARTYFMSRMEPRVQSGLSDEQNVYQLRSAGIERIRIAGLMGWGKTGSATAKVTRLYKAECERRGEDAKLVGRNVSVKTYREAFANAFPDQMWRRLATARDAAARDYSGGLPVLANRAEKVDEAFYDKYPHMRPQPTDPNYKPSDAKVKGPTKAEMAKNERLFYSTSGRLGGSAGVSAANMVDLGGNDSAQRLDK